MTFKEDMVSASASIIDAFGEAVTFNGTFGPYTITVVFDDEFSLSGQLDIECASPQAFAKSADVADAMHGDTLTIGAVTYYIRGIQPDGAGVTRLILSED